ncbi:acyltransferase [Escherichia coli]|nr:acyltransferase [Escherichia coli]
MLRILSMFLIVAHHYSVHGGWSYPVGLDIHKFYAQSLSFGGKLGVNLFVLITGYFSYASRFKWGGVVNTLSKTWFYSISIVLIFYISSPSLITMKDLIKGMLPFGYWFVTTYLVLLVMSPFINAFLSNLSKQKHFKFLVAFTLIAITPLLNSPIGNLSFFVYLYCLGAYIKEYLEDDVVSGKVLLFLVFGGFFLVLSSIASLDFLAGFNEVFNHPLYFIGSSSPFIIMMSIGIFIWFKQMQIGEVRFINIVSSAMFGVYLIHDNSLVRKFLWDSTFQNREHLNSDVYLHSVVAISSVFVVCVVIELLKNKAFDLLNVKSIQVRISRWLDDKLPLM